MVLKSQDQEMSQLIEWRAIMKRIVALTLLFSLVCTSLCLTNVEAKKKTHTVTFNAYNGVFKAKTNADKKIIKFKYKHNEKRGYAPAIKRSKYVFNGWYTKKKGGEKYTSKTRIRKSVKLYPHWLKAYKIDTNYYNLMGKPFLSIEEIEKKTGKLTITKKWNSEEEAVFTSTNGDKYMIYKSICYTKEPARSAYEVYYIDKIKCKAKHIVNIKKATKYSTFMKKIKDEWVYYDTNFKKHKFTFTCGTTDYWETPTKFDETLYVHWSVKMKKNNKIEPNTVFTLSMSEKWTIE